MYIRPPVLSGFLHQLASRRPPREGRGDRGRDGGTDKGGHRPVRGSAAPADSERRGMALRDSERRGMALRKGEGQDGEEVVVVEEKGMALVSTSVYRTLQFSNRWNASLHACSDRSLFSFPLAQPALLNRCVCAVAATLHTALAASLFYLSAFCCSPSPMTCHLHGPPTRTLPTLRLIACCERCRV